MQRRNDTATGRRRDGVMIRLLSACCACLLLAGNASQADEVPVAVAANFRAPLEALAPEFQRRTGHKLVPAYGSTGKFYAQIRNGAPFEVLLAADTKTPARLEQDGAAVAGSRFTYAIGTLVLWSATPGLVDRRGDILRAAGDGVDAQGGAKDAPAKGAAAAPGFDHLALADPKLAPYGAAAVETLQALGLYASVQSRIVQGEDINQAYQFVASGNAALGFVALSQVYVDGDIPVGSAWIVPRNLYTPLRQDAVILAAGRDKPGAQAFAEFLRSDWARLKIAAFGYAPP